MSNAAENLMTRVGAKFTAYAMGAKPWQEVECEALALIHNYTERVIHEALKNCHCCRMEFCECDDNAQGTD